MKLAILFLLFSVIVFSDAFALDNNIATHIAEDQFTAFNYGIAHKHRDLIRMLYDLQPDTDANFDKIIAEYEPFTIEVMRAVITDSNILTVGVKYIPKSTPRKSVHTWHFFELHADELSKTGWKIFKSKE